MTPCSAVMDAESASFIQTYRRVPVVFVRGEGTYLYDQDQMKKYGTGHTSNAPVFTAGKWHHVVLQVTLNDPGRSNDFRAIRH